MTFLPIVARELRVRARLRSTYRWRIVAATSAFLIVAVLLLTNLTFGPTPRMGARIFTTLAGLCLVYCLLEGARGTADCLSREKREGTLGLLFLTDLRGYDVVLGKLVATSINGVYGVLAVFPILAVPLVLGGVTAGEFWRHVLVLLNALFLSLTVGLLVSTLCRDERPTWTWTTTWVAGLTVAPPFLLLAPAGWVRSLAVLSPFTAFLGAFDAAYAAGPAQFWNSIQAGQAMSWLALIAASLLLPRVWQDRPARTVQVSGRRSVELRRAEARERRRLLETNPAIWLAARGARAPTGLWMLVLAAAASGFLAWSISGGGSEVLGIILVVLFLLQLVVSVWVASDACHLAGVGRDTGSLDLLMTTPLTTRQIVDGHLRALKRLFLRPVSILVGTEVFIIASHHLVVLEGERLETVNVILSLALLTMVFAFVLELQAVATYGLWMGLSTKRTGHAVTKTILLVIVLPLLTIVCYPIYPILAVAKNLSFTNYAHDQLRRHLRAILTERSDGGGRLDWTGRTPGPGLERPGQMPGVLR